MSSGHFTFLQNFKCLHGKSVWAFWPFYWCPPQELRLVIVLSVCVCVSRYLIYIYLLSHSLSALPTRCPWILFNQSHAHSSSHCVEICKVVVWWGWRLHACVFASTSELGSTMGFHRKIQWFILEKWLPLIGRGGSFKRSVPCNLPCVLNLTLNAELNEAAKMK